MGKGPLVSICRRDRVDNDQDAITVQRLRRERGGDRFHPKSVAAQQIRKGLIGPLCRVRIGVPFVEIDTRPLISLVGRGTIRKMKISWLCFLGPCEIRQKDQKRAELPGMFHDHPLMRDFCLSALAGSASMPRFFTASG